MSTTTAARYRGNPEAVRALVQPDRVHRDLYIDPELFALEQEHFFANTWNYAGHASQIPNAGDYLSVEIAGRPLLVVRQEDGSIKAMMNRCAHTTPGPTTPTARCARSRCATATRARAWRIAKPRRASRR